MTDTTEKKFSDRISFYVINLDRSVDRMEQFKKDFESFPIPFIRVSAIEGKKLTIPIEDYDAFMFFLRMGRDASPGEIGCYFSHLKVLKMFLESDKEFALICEDDAMPTPEGYTAVEQAIAHADTWDLLRLFSCRHQTSFPYRLLSSNRSLCTQITCLIPAAAYIVNRRAAEILLRKLAPMTGLADEVLFHGRIGIREATVFPNCFLRSEHSNTSTIANVVKRKLKPWHLVYWTCRLYRLRVRIVRYTLQILRAVRRRTK
jgi:glycosyl transferase family 25